MRSGFSQSGTASAVPARHCGPLSSQIRGDVWATAPNIGADAVCETTVPVRFAVVGAGAGAGVGHYWIFTKDPSGQSFVELMTRALDSQRSRRSIRTSITDFGQARSTVAAGARACEEAVQGPATASSPREHRALSRPRLLATSRPTDRNPSRESDPRPATVSPTPAAPTAHRGTEASRIV